MGQVVIPINREKGRTYKEKQAGLSLIEVSVVTAIVLLLAIISVPAVNAFVIENRVPKVAESVARFAINQSLNSPAFNGQPYQGVNNALFINQLGESGVFSSAQAGSVTRVWHGLGKDGELFVEAAQNGSAIEVRFEKVNYAACPGLASVLQRVAQEIAVGQAGAVTTVKSEAKEYSAVQTQSLCEKGDANTFVFTIG